eukprot:10222150-Karenia_brevis.AAC.1
MEGAHPMFGDKLLAGLLHVIPELGGTIKTTFPGASRSLQGWHRLCPSVTVQPLPMAALLLMMALGFCRDEKWPSLCAC